MKEANKIGRAAKAERHAYRRQLPKAIRKAAKGTGWRSVQGCLYREIDGWFVSASPSVNLLQKQTRLCMSVKPMELDPMFWKIVGLEENMSQPLSFRLLGAWTCSPPGFFDTQIAEEGGLDDIAARFVLCADERLPAIREFTIDDFVELCRTHVPRPENFLASTVTALVIMGRKEEALALCKQAIEAGHAGGFMSGRKTFPALAIEYLTADKPNPD